MGVETATFISQLSATNPLGTDPISEGDNQIRLVKDVLQKQFTTLGAAAVTATAAELNVLDGIAAGLTSTELDLLDGCTASTAELNYVDITTAGTVEVSKAVIADGSGVVNHVDYVIQRPEIKDYSETKTALVAAASIPIDLTNGNVFTITPDQNTTFTFTNPSPTGKACAFTLVWTQDASDRTITWPATVDWAGGSAPDVTSGSAKIDIYMFFTMDAGTIWYGFQPGADMG
jgi:hypothetical protein